MKIIHAILIFISTTFSPNYVFVLTKQNLENSLRDLKPQESLWIIGSLADSFENEILFEMAQKNPQWSSFLKSWQPLSATDYKQIVKDFGCSIEHLEIHREIAIENIFEYLPLLNLSPSEERDFRNEFMNQAATSKRVYKQLLMKVHAF